MSDLGSDGNGSDGNGSGVSRRSVLRSVGGGVGLTVLPVGVTPVGSDASGDKRLSGIELARARVDRYGPGRLAEKPGCFKPDERELYGPTDINAQSANQRLAVAINAEGTMTVFRWPRPSFFDQLKYFTRGRDAADEIVVAPNQGAFLGLAVDTGDGPETTWLREWPRIDQHYASDGAETDAAYSDEIVTRYVHADLGLDVRVRDIVAREVDAFVRRVRVIRRGNSPVEAASLIAYANVNPVAEKVPQYPVQDWCVEEDNHAFARYDEALEAIVSETAGVDGSTGQAHEVAVAMGFDGDSDGHQVGGDAHDPAAEPTGDAGPTRDAYDDASTGTLSGNDTYAGQATAALSRPLTFQGAVATETVSFAAGRGRDAAADSLSAVRETTFETLCRRKERWLADVLADAPLPAVHAVEDDAVADTILAAVKRALVTLVTDFDPESGAIVASIATQAPYGQDWPRDGAFFNYVLHLLGLHDWVDLRNRWYADLQQRADDPRPTAANTPPANWNMCYYADGVAGGPIPWQIDTTSFVVWTLVDHYTATGDDAYLRDVYPAVRRAADFLVECRDPSNDLQCRAFEDDRFAEPHRQTINGAATVWLGLRSAVTAASVLGHDDDAARYEERLHELGQAIDRELYDETNEAYGPARAGFVYSETTWPVAFTPYVDEDGEIQDRPQVDDPLDHPRIQRHLTADTRSLAASFAEPKAGELETGQYEAKALIPLAKARRVEGDGALSFVREGVRWLAIEHATDDTHVMGEGWQVFAGEDGDREVQSIISQPHVWEQVLLYLTALEAYPPSDLDFEAGTIGSVLDALRERQRPAG